MDPWDSVKVKIKKQQATPQNIPTRKHYNIGVHSWAAKTLKI